MSVWLSEAFCELGAAYQLLVRSCDVTSTLELSADIPPRIPADASVPLESKQIIVTRSYGRSYTSLYHQFLP